MVHAKQGGEGRGGAGCGALAVVKDWVGVVFWGEGGGRLVDVIVDVDIDVEAVKVRVLYLYSRASSPNDLPVSQEPTFLPSIKKSTLPDETI